MHPAAFSYLLKEKSISNIFSEKTILDFQQKIKDLGIHRVSAAVSNEIRDQFYMYCS